MSFHYRYRKQLLLGLLLLTVLTFLIVGSIRFFSHAETKQEKEFNVPKKQEPVLSTKEKKVEETVQVDIKGAVNQPGNYQIEKDKRVIDAIFLAGGLTENADTTVLNLSKKVFDEMVIIVYSKEEVASFAQTKEKEQLQSERCRQKEAGALQNDACLQEKEETTTNTKINLNTASLEQLQTLPGIGSAKALEIIKYRDAHGGFKSIEELQEVNGIGESIFAQIQDLVTV